MSKFARLVTVTSALAIGILWSSQVEAQIPTLTFGDGTTAAQVPTGTDFATTVVGDPWDFDQASDHVYMFSSDWVGIPTVAGGHLTGTVGSTTLNPGIQVQFEGISGGLNIVDKNGVRFPIDPAQYNRISFRMRRNRTPDPLDLLTVFHYQDTTRATGTGFRYGLSHGFDPNGLRAFVNQSPPADQAKSDRYHVYMMDLDVYLNTDGYTNRWGGTKWNATSPVRGVRIELGEGVLAPGTLAGATIDVDWVRLTRRGDAVRRLQWRGMGGPVTLTATNGTDTIQIFPAQSLAPPPITAVTAFPDDSFLDWDYGFLPPGIWTITATAGALTRTVTLTIDAPPIINLTEPDAAGGRDFARSIEGDAWDMTNREDVFRRGFVQQIANETFAENGLTGTTTGNDPSVDIVSDLSTPSGNSFTIDADVYRHLTFTIDFDRKDLLAADALSLTYGGVARWIWRPNGQNGGLLTNTQDIFVLDGGPATYSMDLGSFTKFGICPDCELESDPGTGTDLWKGLMSVLRFDPYESSAARTFRLADVRLAADDAPNAFGLFTIRWNAAEYAPGAPATPSDLAGATVTLFYDTDTNPAAGLVQIATGVPAGAGKYDWHVAGLPIGRYWIYATIADGHGNSQSRYSTGPVNVGKVFPAPVDANTNGLDDGWEAVFGVSDPGGDDDGDGLTNLEEYRGGTHPLIPQTWNLPEGATGFFRDRIAIANPGPDEADITVTFLRPTGAPIVRDYTVLPASRLTITANEVAGLAQAEFSTVVTATRGGVLVERTMLWDASQPNRLYGGHTGKAIQTPRTQWYLAEGEASFFQTFILLANANKTAATATLTFLFEGGTPVTKSYAVPPNARVTVWANTIPEAAGKAFSTSIASTLPITVERSMYFNTQGLTFNGGHEAAAVGELARDWFVAEGRTGPFFDMYLLLSNPGLTPSTATINYLRPGGAPITKTYALGAQSRATVHVDSQDAALADTDVSASISATEPIIVERAMYWPDPVSSWYEAHDSAGVTRTGTLWVLPDGEFGGPLNWQTYILLANPGTTAATVTLTFLRAGTRTPLTLTRTVPANARLTVSAGQVTGLQSGEQFSTVIESTNAVPIVVEHAIYWDGPNGEFWAAGTNETGIRLR